MSIFCGFVLLFLGWLFAQSVVIERRLNEILFELRSRNERH